MSAGQRGVCLLLPDASNTVWWDSAEWMLRSSPSGSGEVVALAAAALQAQGLPDPIPLLSMTAVDVIEARSAGLLSALSVHSAAFAFQMGLLGVMDRLGLCHTAAASMGVVGEAVAAVAANHLTLDQAAAVVAKTAFAVGRLEAADVGTGMLLVRGLEEDELEQLAAAEQRKARAG